MQFFFNSMLSTFYFNIIYTTYSILHKPAYVNNFGLISKTKNNFVFNGQFGVLVFCRKSFSHMVARRQTNPFGYAIMTMEVSAFRECFIQNC